MGIAILRKMGRKFEKEVEWQEKKSEFEAVNIYLVESRINLYLFVS